MSRLVSLLIVLLAIAVATPVLAEDRLSLSGQMRVRGWMVDDGTDTPAWADQRLRIAGKFSIAEGVSVTFRTDVTERTWGAGGNEAGSGRLPQDGQQWDRAHADLVMNNFHIRAGQQYVGYGMLGGTVNSQDAGLMMSVKGPVSVSAFWLLDDQRGGTSTADSFLYGAQVGHKTDMYAGNVFVAGQTKARSATENVYMVGVNMAMNLSAIKLAAEIDYFTGDASDGVDAVGTQLLVDVSSAISDMVTVGGQFMYALSADADEVQYENLGNDFNGWDPLVDVGTSLSNEQLKVGRPFDFTGDGAGVIGLRGYGKFKVSDAVGMGASLAYVMPEDDDKTNIDNSMLGALGATYKLMANTSLQAQVQYVMVSVDQGTDPDDVLSAGMGLYVNF